jgi:hypothetical protein
VLQVSALEREAMEDELVRIDLRAAYPARGTSRRYLQRELKNNSDVGFA